MKVMQVNCVYGKGSTGHIVETLHLGLNEYNVDSIVCYGRGIRNHSIGVKKTSFELYSKLQNLISRFSGFQYGGCLLSTWYLIHVIKKENPDIVHLHCINGYFVNIYYLIGWLKKNNINTIITQHAEFMFTANCSHAYDCEKWLTGCGMCPNLKNATKSLLFDRTNESWRKMKKSFEGFQNCYLISVSPWLLKRSELSPITSSLNNHMVLNGINTQVFHYYNADLLKSEYGLKRKKVLLYVTPFFTDDNYHVKGGKYIVQLANRLISFKDIIIVVVGNYKREMKLPDNIKLLGYINNQTELAKMYSLADVTLLVSRKETFSMVVAESLCCGTPVVGFVAGGPESIAINDYSEFVLNGDIDSLEDSVIKMLNRPINKESIAKIAQNVYSSKKMVDNYYKEYLLIQSQLNL